MPFTPDLTAALREQADWNLFSALDFAQTHGLALRSVIAKIHAEGLNYSRGTFSAADRRRQTRQDIVCSIAAQLSAPADDLRLLALMDRDTLDTLQMYVAKLDTPETRAVCGD